MTNGAHVDGKIVCVCVCMYAHAHVSGQPLEEIKGQRWSGFLHVRPVAGGNILPEAPSPDQSNLFNIKSVFMDCDPKKLTWPNHW